MNCKQVHEQIEQYYEGVLPVADELGIDIHLVQCAVCADELGGISHLVEDCHQAFETLPSSCDLKGLHSGIDRMEQQAEQQDLRRGWFHKKDLVMHLILALVAVPVFFLVSTKAIETYSAYSEIMPKPVMESTTIPDPKIPNYISRKAVSIDW